MVFYREDRKGVRPVQMRGTTMQFSILLEAGVPVSRFFWISRHYLMYTVYTRNNEEYCL